ncbi:peptide/nickel transport system permease protein [Paenibacillus turicensis]|uniref:Peptide/nickel transport system permease protein n=1 Tax=Paenibacillus turicensis TaxID=160487 RepID=A0ABS4FX65_9BACL|nr:ABC transporter permease [Paenibacillus turicensis]MBP1907174.1 peptide/nickel transport system permease protein [Paenibacillus turicensis]
MNTVQDKEYMINLRKQLKKEQRDLRFKRIKSNYGLIIGAVLFVILLLIALFGPLLISTNPTDMSIIDRLKMPSSEHWLGTDEFGRDLFTRMVYGTRVSIGVGLVVASISSTFGLIIGLYASYYKTLDHILMRICDGLIAIPGILLAIALMAALGASALNVIIALTIVFTPNIARVVRSTALVIREQTYIEAMEAQGASHTRIIWLHIAPNALSPLLVQATFVFAEAIISEAALSFLGAGIPAPAASWGNILQAGKLVIYKAWWMVVFPGATVIISVLSLNLLGDGLRDLLDPHVKQRLKK